MSWRDEFLTGVEARPARPSFSPGLPHFVPAGPNRWVETPYAAAHCVFCPEPLAEGDRIACAEHRQTLEATSLEEEPR